MALKPTSLVNARIRCWAEQKKALANNAEDALYTMMAVVANMTKKEVTPEAVTTLSETVNTTFYNQFSNKDIIYDASIAPEGTEEGFILDDTKFYIDVAENLPEVDYVKIGDAEKKAGKITKVSIGMNAWIYAPMWKVVDGVLKVALPFLCGAADPTTGIAEVTAGGITYEVPVMEPIEAGAALTITDMWCGEIDGHTAEISRDGNTIYTRLGHHGQPAGIVLSSKGTPIVDTSIMIYILDSNDNVSIVKPQTVMGHESTYVFYSFPYENRAVAPEEDGDNRVVTKNLVIPGYGSFSVTIDATQVYDGE